MNRSTARAFTIYSGSRLLVFLGVLVVLLAVGLRGFVLVILAFLISGLISVLLLRRQRAAFAVALEESVERRRVTRAAQAPAEEDELE